VPRIFKTMPQMEVAGQFRSSDVSPPSKPRLFTGRRKNYSLFMELSWGWNVTFRRTVLLSLQGELIPLSLSLSL
jgi:hypothetical protein